MMKAIAKAAIMGMGMGMGTGMGMDYPDDAMPLAISTNVSGYS